MKKIVLFIMLFASVGLQAQTTYTVINTNDSGLGSLRAAADSCVAGDTIRLSPNLIASGSDSIVLTTGDINFDNKGVIIKGVFNSSDTLFISGGDSSRIFSFYGGGKVILDSLVLKNGNGDGFFDSDKGGAVLRMQCRDTLFVINSKISGNTAIEGGAISSSMGAFSSVSIVNSTISGNTATFGGGVYFTNSQASISVSVISSNISDNTAGAGGAIFSSSSYVSHSSIKVLNSIISGNTAAGGAGIYSSSSTSTSSVIITNSIITGNTATHVSGGGVYSDSHYDSSFVSVTNSTISGNTAVGEGGGIYSICSVSSSLDAYSFVRVANSTISGNSANEGGGIYSHCSNSSYVDITSSTISGNTASIDGGGIYSYPSDANFVVNLTNSTISGNTASVNGAGVYSLNDLIKCTSSIIAENGNNSSGIYNNLTNRIISGGYNIFSDTLSGSISSDSTNITAAQLNLQGLAYNGGTTQTMMPGMGSIALSNGNPNDISDSQNSPTVGIRNIGATENCYSLPSSLSVSKCVSYTVPTGSNTYTQSGIYKDTVVTGCGLYSVLTVNLTIEPIDSTVVQSMDTLWAYESGASYQWIDCNSNSIISGAVLQEFVPSRSGSYRVEISKGACVDTSGCFQVVVCDNEAIYSFVDNGSGNIDFTDASIGNYTQIYWSLGDGTTSTLSNPNHVYQADGNYVTVLTINDSLASNSCVSYFIDTISISGVSSSLVCQAGFSVYYDTISGIVNVGNSSLGNTLSYNWDFGDGYLSMQQFPTHSYATNGPFNLCLTIDDGNGCIDTYCDSISNQGVWFRATGFDLHVEGAEPVSVATINLPNKINIYPNPVHDQVNIEIINWLTDGVNIIVRDMKSKRVYTSRVEPISNQEIIKINTSKWARGTYFIEVGQDENRVVKKIEVQ